MPRNKPGSILHVRRRLLGTLAALSASPSVLVDAAAQSGAGPASPPVVPGYRLAFPEDEGSHPAFRLEWWYVTGWLSAGAQPLGFQITFFRARPHLQHENPSLFAARHLVIAHAAISDPRHGRLLHEQKIARAALGLAGAESGRTHVWLDQWSIAQQDRTYRARIAGRDFSLALDFSASTPPLLHGENGFSRKGPHVESASYYYSLPQLRVAGTVRHGGQLASVNGTAWLDHEWSSSYLDKRAAGWDWIGINLEGGGGLMAFRMRDAQGHAVWAGATWRTAEATRVFRPWEVRFDPLRSWRSPRTGTAYPVSFRITLGSASISIEPLMDDQELDARASTGTIYWEGAVRATRNGQPAGKGYLELTGYWRPLSL